MPDPNLEGEFVINEGDEDPSPPSVSAEAVNSTPHNTAHFFSSLVLNPSNITFENQEKDEDIVLLIRRDLITNVPWIVVSAILILIPVLISANSSLFAPFFNISARTSLIAVSFYYLIIFGFIIVQFALWFFNVGIVTTRRIIDFNVAGILYKQLSETKLNLVEDVTYSQVGSIRSIFNYGDVFVQTAGTNENFEFDRAPEPARVVKIIANLIGGPR